MRTGSLTEGMFHASPVEVRAKVAALISRHGSPPSDQAFSARIAFEKSFRRSCLRIQHEGKESVVQSQYEIPGAMGRPRASLSRCSPFDV